VVGHKTNLDEVSVKNLRAPLEHGMRKTQDSKNKGTG
jgi:hypothetical protein